MSRSRQYGDSPPVYALNMQALSVRRVLGEQVVIGAESLTNQPMHMSGQYSNGDLAKMKT